MTIQCDINQTVAISRGHNASSTAKIEVDVTTLTQPQREALAKRFEDGRLKYPKLSEPTLAGFLEALDRESLSDAEDAKKSAATAAQFQADWAEFSAKFDADPESCIKLHDGYNATVRLEGNPYRYMSDSLDLLTPAQRAVFDRIAERLGAERNARVEAGRVERETREAAEKATAEERQTALAAQRQAYLAAHPGPLAERHAAGYASAGEIDDAIRAEVCAGLGVSCTGEASACANKTWTFTEGGGLRRSRDDSDRLEKFVLTDDQFIELKEWKAKLPKDAKISLWDLHDHEENPYGDKDDETKINRLLVAQAEWTVGQLTVLADTQIGTLEDVTKDEG